MKRSMFLALSISMLVLTASRMSFGATPTPTPTPETNQPPSKAKNPHTHQIDTRMHNQMDLITAGFKSGSLTKDQVLNLRATLQSAWQEEMKFFDADGSHEIRTDQQDQINQILNNNSEALGETPVTSAN